jgi:hypothetical protein
MVSQRERLEDIQNYAETLEELKFNSKPHISTLTELARDYGKNRQGREVIEIIKKRIVSKVRPCVLLIYLEFEYCKAEGYMHFFEVLRHFYKVNVFMSIFSSILF